MFLTLNRDTYWSIDVVDGTVICSHKLSDYKLCLPVDDGDDSYNFLYTYKCTKSTKKDANFVRIHLNPEINAEVLSHNSDACYKTVVVKNYHFQDNNNYLFQIEDLIIGISTTVYADAQNFFLESWKQIRPATRIFI